MRCTPVSHTPRVAGNGAARERAAPRASRAPARPAAAGVLAPAAPARWAALRRPRRSQRAQPCRVATLEAQPGAAPAAPAEAPAGSLVQAEEIMYLTRLIARLARAHGADEQVRGGLQLLASKRGLCSATLDVPRRCRRCTATPAYARSLCSHTEAPLPESRNAPGTPSRAARLTWPAAAQLALLRDCERVRAYSRSCRCGPAAGLQSLLDQVV